MDDLERHDKWLCMMWPRLQLLKELMSAVGVMLISIDDNELQNLLVILRELFGEENNLGTIVWKNATDNNPTHIAVEHEYIVCVCRDKENLPASWKSLVSEVREKLLDIERNLRDEFPNFLDRERAFKEWFREHKAELWPMQEYDQIDEEGIFTGSRSVHNPGREGYRWELKHPKSLS